MQTNDELNKQLDEMDFREREKANSAKVGNPFAGYLEKLKLHQPKVNAVHEIVDVYFRMIGKNAMPSEFYQGRYEYRKMAHEAKQLLTACNGNLDDCIWALDKMKYLAEKGKFDWSIITTLKHKLT
jgi:hypothetical protein